MALFLSESRSIEFLIDLFWKVLCCTTQLVNPILQRKKCCALSRALGGSSKDASRPPARKRATGSGCNRKKKKNVHQVVFCHFL